MNEYERTHLKTLRPLLAECMVLLKSNGAFPLPVPGKIALYGNGARNTIKGGTGSGEVNSRFFVNAQQGLEDAGFTVTTKAWLDDYDAMLAQAKIDFVAQVKRRAREKHTNAIIEGMGAIISEPEYELPLSGEGDTAVYVLARISGEGNDRSEAAGEISLTATEKRDILSLQAHYPKFMLVLNVGGPVDLSGLDEVENILVLSQLGVETGAALADVILGKENPSGKLATTWTAWEDYPTIGEFGDPDDTRYKEGIYVGYRYFDSVGVKPLYPFGYGLSYTSFTIDNHGVSIDADTVTVKCSVTNVGSYSGKEVVQIYVSVPSGKLDQPYQSLAGFAKTPTLSPGESVIVKTTFRFSDLASYDEETQRYILEPGDYVIRIGNSSADTVPCAIISLSETTATRIVRHCGGKPDFIDWKPERKESVIPNVPHLVLDSGAMKTETISYEYSPAIEPLIKTLSDEELAYMNVGSFSPGGGVASIIGSASTTVAGAAGETTHNLIAKGISPIIMADGPAGIRISREYVIDEKGAHPIGQTMPESLTMFMPKWQQTLMGLLSPKPKKGLPIQTHYMTAIPIGTAIAQSWNLELAQSCGDIVGDEMERVGVHLWLAPALNIHRSIRCGRNFEYYSEDPLLSGKFAAAVTRGVQSHPGCGTVIKHFACNNQETNRYCNNSVVSERALREIYLRGFEICVKESRPHAVMTSYNLLNGTHTSERRDLIESVLRGEWGFEGIVMTDWLVAMGTNVSGAKHPAARADRIAAAGHELIMPGSKGDWKNILNGLKEGSVTRAQLEENASRLYRLINTLRKNEA